MQAGHTERAPIGVACCLPGKRSNHDGSRAAATKARRTEIARSAETGGTSVPPVSCLCPRARPTFRARLIRWVVDASNEPTPRGVHVPRSERVCNASLPASRYSLSLLIEHEAFRIEFVEWTAGRPLGNCARASNRSWPRAFAFGPRISHCEALPGTDGSFRRSPVPSFHPPHEKLDQCARPSSAAMELSPACVHSR